MLKSVNVLFGQPPPPKFIEDIASLKKLKKEELLETIDLVSKWYPREDIDKEWEEWKNNLGKEQAEARKDVIRVILLIMKELASNSLLEKEAEEDFKNLEIPLEYLDYIIEKIKSSPDFKNKALNNKKPYEAKIIGVDWRLDKRFYQNGIQENIAVIEINYTNKANSDVICFDLNLETLRQLINRLNKIKEELCILQ